MTVRRPTLIYALQVPCDLNFRLKPQISDVNEEGGEPLFSQFFHPRVGATLRLPWFRVFLDQLSAGSAFSALQLIEGVTDQPVVISRSIPYPSASRHFPLAGIRREPSSPFHGATAAARSEHGT